MVEEFISRFWKNFFEAFEYEKSSDKNWWKFSR